MMVVYFNRRWLAESARQGWSREDVTLLFGSLDPGDEIVDLDPACALIVPPLFTRVSLLFSSPSRFCHAVR